MENLDHIKQLMHRISLARADTAMSEGLFGEIAPFPPLQRTHISEVEQQLDVKLPKEYAEFLTGIADGGYFGACDLYPLQEAFKTFIHSPFIVPPDSFVADADGYDFPEEASNKGCVGLMDFGCGSFAVLPILGPERGVVWEFYGADDGLWHTYRESFLQWFARQLRDGLVTYDWRVQKSSS
jgi:hypothetical protein